MRWKNNARVYHIETKSIYPFNKWWWWRKKAEGTKKCVIRWKLKFEDYEHCLETTQQGNEINQLKRKKHDADSLKENQKEFVKNSKFILKSQQRFRGKKHNLFAVDVNRTALSASDDKKIYSIHWIERCPYAMNKDLVFKKEEIKCNNLIKQYKNS